MVKFRVSSVASVLVATAMCFSSTVATASTVPVSRAAVAPMSISPFVALSAYGTLQSRSAVCAAAVGASAAAAQAQVPGQGCVLPVLDQVAPAAVDAAPVAPVAVTPVAGSGFGIGIGALLAGLVLVTGLAAVLFSGDGGRLPIGEDGGLVPISPS